MELESPRLVNLIIRSKKSHTWPEDILEVLIIPEVTDLKRIRTFLLKTFINFPVKFSFQTHDGKVIDKSTEPTFTVNMLSKKLLFIHPYMSTGSSI